jgi:hypothetical protein
MATTLAGKSWRLSIRTCSESDQSPVPSGPLSLDGKFGRSERLNRVAVAGRADVVCVTDPRNENKLLVACCDARMGCRAAHHAHVYLIARRTLGRLSVPVAWLKMQPR